MQGAEQAGIEPRERHQHFGRNGIGLVRHGGRAAARCKLHLADLVLRHEGDILPDLAEGSGEQGEEGAELADAIALLHKGHSVAWYQDRLEFGLRALGNRSILASPFSRYVAENLNHYVKHRDEAHPFILSVPDDAARAFFDCTDNARFAASVGRLGPSLPDLERFADPERRVRVHTVAFGGEGGSLSVFGFRLPMPGGGEDIDEAGLQRIAEQTGGRFFRARDTESLAGIYAEIDRLEPIQRPGQAVRPRIERLVREWQGDILDMVRKEGKDRRTNARIAAVGVNGIALFLMLVAFAHTGGLLGAEVGEAVGGRHDVEVVFDHHHRVPAIDQPVEAAIRRATSAMCSPVVGSSRT